MALGKSDDLAQLRLLRTKEETAIALALKSRWPEAVEVNRNILEMAPDDVGSLNRLAKALLELGQLDEARDAINKAVALEPTNTIARRNAQRLMRVQEHSADPRPSSGTATAYSLALFVEEAGKSATARLVEIGAPAVVQRLAAGEPVHLVRDASRLRVQSQRDEYVGRVEPRVAQRVLSLMDRGNRYVAAVIQMTDHEIKVVIREVYQDPSQVGKISFPALRFHGFRADLRGGRNLVDYDSEEPVIDGVDDEDAAQGTVRERKRRAIEPSEDDEDESD